MGDLLIRHFPHLLHGGDYNPDQWLASPQVIEEDFRLFDQAGCNTFSMGIFSWSRLEPSEGVYDFGWLDTLLDRMAKAGKNVALATPSGAKPFWLSEKYEEVRRVDRQGRRGHSGGRHNHCWTSPVYREKVRQINTLLAERYAHHPAVKVWHVSNEYGGECLCELCCQRFREWLQERYGSLERLNAAYWTDFWSHRFTDWSQISPLDENLDGLTLDWKRFVSWQVSDFYRWEAEPLRRAAPAIPVLTNLMGFSGDTNYHDLAPHLDLVADDSYPCYDADAPDLAFQAARTGMRFDYMRCLKGQPRPWLVMESCIDGASVWGNWHLKPPGLHHLEMFQALAHGAEGTLYFQCRKGRGGLEKHHGAVIHHTHPAETRNFGEVRALAARYEKLTDILGSVNHAEVALLWDWDSCRAYQTAKGLPRGDDPNILTHHAAKHYQPFWRRGMTVDVLSPAHDFSGYKFVVIPRLYMLRAGLAQRLKAFVQAGGVILASAMLGMVNETNLCWTDGCPGDGLEELAGVWMEEYGRLSPHAQSSVTAGAESARLGLKGQWEVDEIFATLHPRQAEVLARYTGGWLDGKPALTVRSYGAGKFYYLAADLESSGLDALYESIIRSLSLDAHQANGAALPPGVTVQRREHEGRCYYFALNFSNKPQTLTGLAEGLTDMETGASISKDLTLQAWEARVMRG